jgi:uncharacterized delta-60 repeat protein
VVDFSTVTHPALQADGKIVAAGPFGSSDSLMRLNPDASFDPAFGLGGKVATGNSVVGLAVQSDGKILVAGVPDGTFAVTRLYGDGSHDARFGVAGTAMISGLASPNGARGIALQPDGQIVVAGTSNGDFAVVRYIGGPSQPLSGTPNQRFVTQLYLDLLVRPVDPSGLTFWSGLLDQGATTRTEVVQAIENSPEYRTDIVEHLYGRVFRRAVDPSGSKTWGDFLARGGTAEQLEAILLGSPEYFGISGGANTGFINALYGNVLHRAPDSGGAQTWSQALSSGAMRDAVAAAVLGSPESDGNEVQGLYHRYLHRAADPAGFNVAVSALQHGMTNEQLTAALTSSKEYFSAM